MKNSSGDTVRLKHILDAIQEIELYIKDINFQKFTGNSMMLYASIKQLEIIGEAANQITEDTKNKIGDIDWDGIVGLRHILVHEYFGVDHKIIWDIVKNDLPVLKEKLKSLI